MRHPTREIVTLFEHFQQRAQVEPAMKARWLAISTVLMVVGAATTIYAVAWFMSPCVRSPSVMSTRAASCSRRISLRSALRWPM